MIPERQTTITVTESTVRQLDILSPNLDRIKVIWEDFELGKGQLTIVCWGLAWTGFWGSMGGEIRQFVPAMDAGYIASKMDGREQRPTLKRYQKNGDAYLIKIITVVQQALREHLRAELHGRTN